MATESTSNNVKDHDSCHQLLFPNDQIILPENANDAYHQSEGLFSISKDSQKIKDTSLQLVHCNNLDEALFALKSGANYIEIPDDVYRKLIEDALKTGHPDNPGCLGHNGF